MAESSNLPVPKRTCPFCVGLSRRLPLSETLSCPSISGRAPSFATCLPPGPPASGIRTSRRSPLKRSRERCDGDLLQARPAATRRTEPQLVGPRTSTTTSRATGSDKRAKVYRSGPGRSQDRDEEQAEALIRGDLDISALIPAPPSELTLGPGVLVSRLAFLRSTPRKGRPPRRRPS